MKIASSYKFDLDLSIVIPLFNEEESLPELCEWIVKVVNNMQLRYEILLVDDGSNDNSWQVILDLSKQYETVKGLSFNRNYGKSAALQMGFKECTGEVVITMDADLQDSPDEIPGLYGMIKNEGFDLVSGWKKKRYDPIMKTIPSKLFNGVTRLISGIQLNDFNCGLKAYKGRLVKSIDVYGEMHRYIPVIAKQNGFGKIGERPVQHRARKYGTTKFGLERFIFGFLDLLSISFVTRYRKRPMHFFGTWGMLFFLAGCMITFWLIGQKLYYLHLHNVQVREVTAQPLFYMALVTSVVGVQLFLAGFLGEMIHVTNGNKSDYLIAEKIGFEKPE